LLKAGGVEKFDAICKMLLGDGEIDTLMVRHEPVQMRKGETGGAAVTLGQPGRTESGDLSQ
jgi:hypothetical protein